MPVNETHDPELRSWVPSANVTGGDFPVQNLPLGVFRRFSSSPGHIGVAIGDEILDLNVAADRGLFDAAPTVVRNACRASSLNELMRLGPHAWMDLRSTVSGWLRADADGRSVQAHEIQPLLVAQSQAAMLLPSDIGDYTDFYASIFHATNIGSMLRPDEPLLPNYKHLPIAYHGRASSVAPSGTPVRRPVGQVRPDGASEPLQIASRRLDYELEVGAFIGPGNALGEPIPLDKAEQHVFGICLLNDWSARDIQAWEYQPLGPFLAKSFATSISPWIVTLEALEPFRAAAVPRPDGDPGLLAYLDDERMRARGSIDLRLEVALCTARMRQLQQPPHVVSRSNLRHLYWTLGQMVTHHASNGCNLRPGDLLGTGTVSGPTRESRGCLLELTWRGTEPLQLPTGETRGFLEDGDEVVMRGWCEREGAMRIGLGECRGRVTPAREIG
jgi:fumarylacetoacetase